MTVVVTVQHPAHVHFFKHAIENWEAAGHEVRVFAREKEMAIDLLEAYDIDHEVLAGASDSLLSLARVQATYEARLLRRALALDPDVITAIGGVAAAHVAAATGAKSVVFYDTEHAELIQRLAYPLADAVFTPDCFGREVEAPHVGYAGYHELAYLHPDRFDADPAVVEGLGADPDDRLVVLRLVDWGASHDVGNGGFGDVREVVERLEAAGGEVLITAEGALPSDLESRRVSVAPERMHDLLAHADLFVGEGATMAAESAVLGTPAVYVNTLSMGYTDELADYGLLYHFDGEERHRRGLDRAVAVLEDGDPETYAERREAMLADKTDAPGMVERAVAAVASGTPDDRTRREEVTPT
ncbi:DUF354 domain-containing protein (plasmid) [Halorussus vallis]|uniref:DUF354 domain-containing protein n=1 Tax=Halorussus vallis TaxID=2953749 RepID=UPI00209DF7BF|nr:DUF354 domain-containing protein [Halorussus vallis]USZ78426.1 DUF354 domain-containing protein [Halorussus vallis]